jgi:hypothetical protein
VFLPVCGTLITGYVLQTTPRSQTAVMNLAPGKMSGDEAEAHLKSDQIVIVRNDEGAAEVGDEHT